VLTPRLKLICSLLHHRARSDKRNGPIRIMRGIVTGQRASIGSLVVGDRGAAIWSHHVGVEADQPLARGIRNATPDPVPRVAGRATESCIDVLGMLRKTRILQHIGKIVALPA